MNSSFNSGAKKRNIYRISTLVILLIGLVYTGIRFLPGKSLSSSSIINSVPVDAAIIVKTKNLDDVFSALKSNSFWKEISQFDITSDFVSQFMFIDSVSNYRKEINTIFSDEVYFSVHLLGLNKLKPVFYFSLQKNKKNQIKNAVIDIIGEKGMVTDRKYENFTIYDCNISGSDNKFSFTFYQNRFIISPSSLLLENSIRQINSGYGIASSKGFKRVQSTSGKNSLANIYINYKNIPSVFAIALEKSLGYKVKRNNNFAEWTELDLTLKNNLLMMNGFTYTSDSLNNIENILLGQEPQKFTLHNVFPSASNSFFALLFSDTELFKDNYFHYLVREAKDIQYKSKLAQYKRKYKTDFEKLLYNSLENEMGVVKCNIHSNNGNQEQFFVIHTKGENSCMPSFKKMIEDWAEQENGSVQNYMVKYSVDEGAQHTIYRFPIQSIIDDLFGTFFSFNEAKYFAFINNYLVFSENKSALSKLIYSNVLNKTLEKSLEYADFNEYVNSKSNLFYYIKIPKAKNDISKYLNESINNVYVKYHESFEKINTLAFQTSGEGDMLYNNITVNYVEEKYDNPTTEWETLLDTAIEFKPVFVENHYTHEYEIFVQDMGNKIYLINNSGRIVWKQQLDNPIISEVFQIDYYRNGKLQLLFSTKNAIHLIDRNGNPVERYPVKLRSSATAGMALFDYDKNKKYRIFIPCENKKVYAYSVDGKIIPGWGFSSSDHLVINPIQHFRIGSKDYIVFGDKAKTYILNRKGETRVTLKQKFTKSKNNQYYLNQANGKPCIVTSDAEGNVQRIYFDGSVENVTMEKISAEHYFELNDVNADNINDYIFIDGENLKAFDNSKKRLLSHEFENNIYTPFAYYHFSSKDRKLGIVDKVNDKIYLINNDGKLYKGFPLIGTSMFTIGVLENNYGRFNLIVGGKNNYLYNYAIN